jgi:hypothetical protein
MSYSKEVAADVATETTTASAIFTLNSSDAILLPNVRVGTPDSMAVIISNGATAPAAGLDVTGFAAGGATVAGSIRDLQAGSTDASGISVGLDTGTAGVAYGEVLLLPVSDAGVGETVALAGTVIDLFGNVFALADPVVPAVTLYTRVGDPGTATLTVSNGHPADHYLEDLIAALTGTSGGICIGNAGPTGDIAAGASDQSLTVSFSTAQIGTISGAATVAAISDGGTGPGSIDGAGTLALAPLAVPIHITVENLATLGFEDAFSPFAGGTLDFGTLPNGASEDGFLDLMVVNTANGPADVLAGTYSFSSVVGSFSFGPYHSTDGSFSALAVGDDVDLVVYVHTNQSGTFVGTITVDAESTLPDGSDPVALPARTVVVEANTSAEQFACFMAGTQIATPAGMVPVEALREGDLVCVTDGRALPVRWLGRQTVALRFADPLRVLPIRVRAGALGERQPLRDLLLSPDHALFVDGVLIQAGALVNGLSIVRETDMPAVFTYYHVELAEHSLVLAEGAPAETFIDHVERMVFDNWAEHAALHGAGEPIIEMDLPRAKAQRQVPGSIRARLSARAAALFDADALAA